MAQIFCPSCGAKSVYEFAAPNFCSKCGVSYRDSLAAVSPEPRKQRATLAKVSSKVDESYDDEEDEDDDDEDGGGSHFTNASRVPALSKISVEVDSGADDKTGLRMIKFQDLIPLDPSDGVVMPKPTKRRL